MPHCLIVSPNAAVYAAEIERLADTPVPVKACTSVEIALAEYSSETILFGSPGMIADILPKMPTVDWVQSSWAGVTPLIAYQRRDYALTGVKDVFGSQMSEYVIGYLLAHELKVLQRRQEQTVRRWFGEASGTLEGKRIGIMGTGSIGQHIAATATIFGMTVAGLSRSGSPAPGFDQLVALEQLHEFLAGTDYLISTLPQTADTDRLLNAATLAILPAHAFVVNVGRSNVIDHEALVDALENRRLAGAALDVFDQEPLPQDSPLWDAPNLSITGHIAAVSRPSLIVPIFLENYRRYVAQKPLKHVIDFDAGY